MLNFAVGAVKSDDDVRKTASEQIPYFRTEEFSEIMLENESLIKDFAKAPQYSRVSFITGSGTASMEASVINLFDKNDRLVIVNGGSFGERFAKICNVHGIPYSEIKLQMGKNIHAKDLEPFENKGYTGFLVNIHETSTGVLYDLDLIGSFCKRNNIFLVVDAISSFLADSIDMSKYNIGVLMTGSQKALACDPGISIIVLSPDAISRLQSHECCCMYLDLKEALKDGERGQTPFTPAVGILRQINTRLKKIAEFGGVEEEITRIHNIATNFRSEIKSLPFEITSESLSNAVTPLHPINNVSAYDVFKILKKEYGIWVCPNGGELANKIFRVGHMGALTVEDNATLLSAFKDMMIRGLL